MVQSIKCLSNGLYSLKNSHIPFGMGLNSTSVTRGLSLARGFPYGLGLLMQVVPLAKFHYCRFIPEFSHIDYRSEAVKIRYPRVLAKIVTNDLYYKPW